MRAQSTESKAMPEILVIRSECKGYYPHPSTLVLSAGAQSRGDSQRDSLDPQSQRDPEDFPLSNYPIELEAFWMYER